MDFLNRILIYPLDQLPFYLITLVIAFTLHEFSHAYFANKFGDPTAKLLGRVTLNPAVHFDLLGIILLMIAGFGWARPVPVNRDNFSKPRLMGVIVSAAGPLSNLLLGRSRNLGLRDAGPVWRFGLHYEREVVSSRTDLF
ncbi:hypothetical protein HMSSN139_20500 [Paenibacillus sp. HMSSN-139]|nr:hypothetical protein HMSSN139_20500 [Paenibacillus sp. HMSSN-139]